MASNAPAETVDTGRMLRDLARAAGGALVFSLPMLMTMEMWWLGLGLDRTRLLVLFLVSLPLLVVLSRQIGFERTAGWRDDVFDATLALGISAIVCLGALFLFGTITLRTPIDEAVGKVAIQMVPAAIGALLARSQFSAASDADDDDDASQKEETYGGELFLMAVGALFLGFNVAPTEEMMLISYQMTAWHGLFLVLLSVAVMHAFVFAVGFAGGSEQSPDEPWWNPLIRLTVPGYVVALSISLFLLWVFARLDGLSPEGIVLATVVLGFPTAIGAAAARLIL